MAHVRKLIRDNVTTALTGLSITGSNVFKTRVIPLDKTKLPAICVYANNETTEYGTINPPRTQMRTLELTAEVYVKGTSDVDDSLDAISVELEEALYTDLTRGGYAKDTKITSFVSDYNADGEQTVGIGNFTIEVTYVILENDIESSV